MIAYFIGGAWDLTKRPMTHCPPVWEILIFPRLPKLAIGPEDVELVSNIKCERELYVRAHHDHDKEVAIYIYEDWYS